MATTDMNPQTAMAMELIRGLLDLSRMADSNRTAAEHQRAVVSALPCITGNLDALFGPDLIDVVFQQIALNAEAVSNDWSFNGYGLIPVGDVEQRLNSVYDSGALNTYGLDVGYFISPALHASVGYYYQHRDQEDVDGSGVRGRLAYDITQGVTAGVNISYDEAFDTRVSADLQVRFGGPSTTTAKKKKCENPTINAFTASPKNRDVRVHVENWFEELGKGLWQVAKMVGEGVASCLRLEC